MTYDEYLLSPWWAARKAAIIRFRGCRCERCGAEDALLQLHHRTYERLFRELPDDLELLCNVCHEQEHGLEHHPRGRDIEKLSSVIERVDWREWKPEWMDAA